MKSVPTRGRPSGRLAGLQGRQSAEESAYDTHRHAFTLVRSQTCLNSFSLSPFPTLLPGPFSQPPAPAAPPSSSAHTTTFLSLLIHLPGPSFSEAPSGTPLTHRHRDLLNPLVRTRRLVVGCTASRTFRLAPLPRLHSSSSSPSLSPLLPSLYHVSTNPPPLPPRARNKRTEAKAGRARLGGDRGRPGKTGEDEEEAEEAVAVEGTKSRRRRTEYTKDGPTGQGKSGKK
ncbi:hypothetical protein ALC57_07834 [Trachymyrmex cornetzi]|uniref:Uncharacterized protein n=1 Tax=Trachymyrmex cornetzi TaxID=471704 RepID=A0A195E4K6_9HYME|nr:hypothetical protein ALC57_07834 [Trachymyrmex cornetzi]